MAPSLSCNVMDDSVRIRTKHAAPIATTTTTRGTRRREASSALSMAMKGRPAPQLTEEELTAMGNARDKVFFFFCDYCCSTTSAAVQ